VGAELELEGLLEPHGLGVVGERAVVVAAQRGVGLRPELALLVAGAEAAAPPAGLEQAEQLVERPAAA
jgi:hypothetical protein